MEELELLQTDTQDVKLRKVVEHFSYYIRELLRDVSELKEEVAKLQQTRNYNVMPAKFMYVESYLYRLNKEFKMEFSLTDLSFALYNLGYINKVKQDGKKYAYVLSDKATIDVMRLDGKDNKDKNGNRRGLVKNLLISEMLYENEILPYFKRRFQKEE